MIVKTLVWCILVSITQSSNITQETKCHILVRDSEISYTAHCSVESNLILSEGICISAINQTQLVVEVCPYSYYQQEYIKRLNTTVTPEQFNEVMCGPLNREGLFCRKCKSGYGVPVFSKIRDKCVKCTSKPTWLLYLAVKLLPVTLFYILVIIFNFSATRPPITAYIFYCQLFIHIIFNIQSIQHFFESTNHTFLYLTWTVCDLWNLNMLQLIIPSFCLSPHFNTNIHSFFLELMFTLYPIFLIILTVVLIEMHASNIRIIVWLWKPFYRCFASVRRSWDPRSSVVNAIASFLLLLSFKVVFISSNLVYRAKYQQESTRNVLYYDPLINLDSIYRQYYFIPVMFLNLVFVFLPMLFLFLYPTRVCRRLLHCVCSGRMRSTLFLFMDNFQGCYKNGTAGTYDYRSASCLGFLLRLLVVWMLLASYSRKAEVNNSSVTRIALLLMSMSLFCALVRPYKRRHMNILESLLYATGGYLLILILHQQSKPQFHYKINIYLSLLLMPSVTFFGFLLYKALKALGMISKILGLILPSKKYAGVEAEPDRIVNPTEYTPLIDN